MKLTQGQRQLSVALPSELHIWLRTFVIRRGTTMGQVVRAIVRAHLEQHSEPADHPHVPPFRGVK